jgi:signal transduction histidine kinase
MLEFFLIIDLVIILSLLFLAVLSLHDGGYKRLDNVLFSLFSILVAIWIPANHISNDVSFAPSTALFADFFVFSCSFTAMIVLMYFLVHLTNSKKLIKYTNYSLVPLALVAIASATPLVAESVVQELNATVYTINFGPFVSVYAVGLFYMVAMVAYSILYSMKHLTGRQKQQVRTIRNGLMVSLPLVVMFSFVLPLITGDFSYTEFGIAPLILLVIALYYSVIKHSLFDIRLAAVRSGAYLLTLITLSVVYYFLAYILSITLFGGETSTDVSINPVNVLLALILAFIFQPIKKFFDKITNKVFYRDRYNNYDFFTKLNRVFISSSDLRVLLQKAALEISRTLKAEQAFFFVYINEDHHVSSGTQSHTILPVKDVRALDEFVHQTKSDIIVESLLPPHSHIRRLMLSHKTAIILPLVRGVDIIGYFALGEHQGRGYVENDVKVLRTIADELIIAIQNARSIEEIKELNATLQDKVNEATKELRASNAQLHRLDEVKDEFMSMASHQLRTPLTSIKGYISMLLEGDAGQVRDEQKNLLQEAFNSSERMVRLIGDFLNVSRLQTGKFMLDRRPVDLVSLVQNELNALKQTAISRGHSFDFKQPDNIPMINIDENKIQQVVMNFSDNALYYSKDPSVIRVSVRNIEDKWVEFTIKDTGIGVPKEQQEQLFSKFFRASNARKQRPDGTGVGLFLAKKVIDAHNGEILFSSQEGKGSTFGFRLPLK